MRVAALACLPLAAACGDIETVAGDAGPTADAGPPDARAAGSITVRVGRMFGPTQPLADNRVVLIDTAGDIRADVRTDFAQPPAGTSGGRQALVGAPGGAEP